MIRLNDGSYPAGVYAGLPGAPWNEEPTTAHFHCALCEQPGGPKDLAITRKVHGVEEHLCATCAEAEGYMQCDGCGKYGTTDDVLWCPDRKQHFHEACGERVGLALCTGCGILAEAPLDKWHGEELCSDCMADVIGQAFRAERQVA